MSDTVAVQGTHLNDIRFSPDGRIGYLTDNGTRAAIVVVDLESGKSWRALDGHPSTRLDKSVIVAIQGKPLRRPDGRQPAFGVDGNSALSAAPTPLAPAAAAHRAAHRPQ